jgi:hypothetical protein
VYDCMYGFISPRNVSSSMSEEECILKRVCLSVRFYSFTGCIHKLPISEEVLSNGTEAS